MKENILNTNREYQKWLEWSQKGMTPDEMFFLIHFGWQNPRLMNYAVIFAPYIFLEMQAMKNYYEKYVFKSGDQQ